MSTKAIRELILLARPWREEAAKKALAEVEAIERLAKDACAGDVTHRLTASDSGLELGLLLEQIAEEAP